ncbi:MAG: LamG-like jellyroll fold domain-containing protein, partial [Candidatus Micrarchaeia archaeon]
VYKHIVKRSLTNAFLKAQSAMEYLMTYGWAILIIAVVLAALFQLGVFNANNFAPKAPPGSCQVFRPNGPKTTFDINLEGVCNNELPQYVMQSTKQNAYIYVIEPGLVLQNGGNATLTAWLYANNPNSGGWRVELNAYPQWPSLAFNFNYYNNSYNDVSVWTANTVWNNANIISVLIPLHTWVQLVEWVNQSSNTFGVYLNGVPANSMSFQGTEKGINYIQISPGSAVGDEIANVQIYNTSLSASEIKALYQEGIGGAPINLQHLVAWYPLNGDTNDYSGDYNSNGEVINNVTFTSNWWNSYTPP